MQGSQQTTTDNLNKFDDCIFEDAEDLMTTIRSNFEKIPDDDHHLLALMIQQVFGGFSRGM